MNRGNTSSITPLPGPAARVHSCRRQLARAALRLAWLAAALLLTVNLFAGEAEAVASVQPSVAHWLAGLAAFVGTVRLFAKWIQLPLQNFLTAAIARVNDSPEKDDDQLLHNMFGSLEYRFFAFLMDYLLSLKLPTSDSLLTHREEKPK